MRALFRFSLILMALVALVACESASTGSGSIDGEGIETDGIATAEGIAAATKCETNDDCATVFEVGGCFLAACDPVEGHCRPLAKPEGTSCEAAESACGGVGQGVCDADGACQVDPETITEGGCDDGNPCTVDDCHPELGCLSTLLVADDTECDDGDPCTTNTSCQEGMCVGDTVEDCETPKPDDPSTVTGPQACLEEVCADELSDCASVEGCMELRMCLNQCGPGEENSACRDACVDDASGEAFDAYVPTWLCGVGNGCFQPDGVPDPVAECLVDNCGDEYTKCLQDDGCFGLIGCFGDCGDNQGCLEQCWQSAPNGVKQLYSDFRDCYGENDCQNATGPGPGPGPDDPNVPDDLEEDPVYQCLEEECPGELGTCVDDPGCLAAITCLSECDGNEACENGCFNNLQSGASQAAFFQLGDCVEVSGCGEVDGPDGPDDPDDPQINLPDEMKDCLEDECDDQYEACADDNGCVELLGCLQQCPPGNQQCENVCYSDASQNDINKFLAMVQCGQANDCFGEPDEPQDPVGQCLADDCDDSYEACVTDDGCVSVFGCMDECGPDDVCRAQCVESVSGSDQEKFVELIACGIQEDCFSAGQPDDQPSDPVGECIVDECLMEQLSCSYDVGCVKFAQCNGQCEDDEACVAECKELSDDEGLEKWGELIECGLEEECFENDGPPGGPDDPGEPKDSVVECLEATCGDLVETNLPGAKSTLECIASCDNSDCGYDCADDAPAFPTKKWGEDVVNCGIEGQCFEDSSVFVPDSCGNGQCDSNEDGKNCPEDCNEPGTPVPCIDVHCKAQQGVCYDTGNCGEAWECWAECDAPPCQMACTSELEGDAEEAFTAVLSCGETHGCYNDGPPLDPECGNDVCEMGENGFNCPDDCKGPSEPGDSDPDDPDDDKPPTDDPDETFGQTILNCAESFCNESFSACFEADECSPILQCIEGCGDEDCITACAFDPWPPEAFWSLYDCTENAGCLSGD